MLKTESQRADLCSSCPVARVADLVGDSCVLLIIRDLLTGPKRFKDFTTSLEGVSSRTITLKLQYLEQKGLVKRTQYNEHPPRVEYTLTVKGKKLDALMKAMHTYGKSLQ